MIKFTSCFIALSPILLWATEVLRPVQEPQSILAAETAFELYDDVYSLDEIIFLEYSPFAPISFYTDASFRFLSYSYEFSKSGYIHNYCNLHVNGFNETYLGMKAFFFERFGLNLNWRFPPGEGSKQDRFHRLNIEPFTTFKFSNNLHSGISVLYNTFLEDKKYIPGDEFGIKGSLVWNFFWIDYMFTGWEMNIIILYKQRFTESKNKNLNKPYQEMKDTYKGIQSKIELMRHFMLFERFLAFGLTIEHHTGTYFGFESGYRIGLKLDTPLKGPKHQKN